MSTSDELNYILKYMYKIHRIYFNFTNSSLHEVLFAKYDKICFHKILHLDGH